MRNTEDLFLVCNCTYTLNFLLLCGRRLFICFLTNQRQLFGYSTFLQVALLMKILPTFKLLSSKSLIHNNDAHIVIFLQNSKLSVAQMLSRSVTCYVFQRDIASIMNIGFVYVFVSECKVNLSARFSYVVMQGTTGATNLAGTGAPAGAGQLRLP